MGKKLYVGNLTFSTTEQSINEMFAQYGTVESVNIIADRETGRSKGFAFVEMSSDNEANEANEAIQKLNGTDHEGRAISVSEAKPQVRRESRSGFGGRKRRL